MTESGIPYIIPKGFAEPRRLFAGERTRLGRSDDNDFMLASDMVSRYHAVIDEGQGGWVVRDLGSKNGTRVNGTLVATHLLRDGDLLRFGSFELAYRELSVEEAAGVLSPAAAQLGAATMQMPEAGDLETTLHGDLLKLTAAELVQHLHLAKRSGLLLLTARGVTYRLSFREGAVSHADAANIQGEEAVRAMLRVPSGSFQFDPDAPPGVPNMSTPIEKLLFEAASGSGALTSGRDIETSF